MHTSELFQHLFEPRSVAFIGASHNVFKWGFNILHNIVQCQYAGRIYPVNPQGGEWYGHPIYRSLEEIPGPVDLAIIVVAKELVLQTVGLCVQKKIPAAVIITAGFSETGAEGRALETAVVAAARAGNMRLVGPNTMGIFSAYPSRLQAIMAAAVIPAGPVALIVQSGNLGASLSYRFSRRGIGLSRMISSGNEADLTMEDYLELLEQDEKTRLICLYIEGVREGPRFFEAARRIARTKPILLLKGGVTASGALAARSHTGAMAGNDAVFRHICRQTGIIQVETMDEMADTVGMFLSQPRPAGNRVGIVTLGGGWGVLATDLCETNGLTITPLSDPVVAMMDGFLPPFWSRRNPVDLVAPNGVTVIIDAIRVLIEHGGMDAVLMLGLGYSTSRARRWLSSTVVPQTDVEKQAGIMISEELKLVNLLIEQIQQYRKPIIPVMDIVTFDEVMENNPVQYLERHGIMSYSAPDQAIRALAHVVAYYARLDASGKESC